LPPLIELNYFISISDFPFSFTNGTSARLETFPEKLLFNASPITVPSWITSTSYRDVAGGQGRVQKIAILAVAVKNTGERFVIPTYKVSNDIEICSREATQVNIRHQLKVLVPVFLVEADFIHLLGRVDQIGIIRLSRATAVLGLGGQADKTKRNQ
jgi:hypothetical protein